MPLVFVLVFAAAIAFVVPTATAQSSTPPPSDNLMFAQAPETQAAPAAKTKKTAKAKKKSAAKGKSTDQSKKNGAKKSSKKKSTAK